VSAPRVRRPESLAQGREFDRRSRGARLAGLCATCAPQSAYAYQVGAAPAESPCSACAPIVATWPGPDQPRTGWRRLPRTAAAKPGVRVVEGPGVITPAGLSPTQIAAEAAEVAA
jgi:hypothetical protein